MHTHVTKTETLTHAHMQCLNAHLNCLRSIPSHQTLMSWLDDKQVISVCQHQALGEYTLCIAIHQRTFGVVRQVQLYFGLLVCANGSTGGSMRYHVSRTRHASWATDMAQYGTFGKMSLKPVRLRGGCPTSWRVQASSDVAWPSKIMLPPEEEKSAFVVHQIMITG